MTDSRPPNPSPPAPADAALEGLVRRYLPVVYAAARRQLPDTSLAEDVTQAVFMVLARRHGGLPANTVLSSWLLKVTHLACLQARRNAGRRRQHEWKAAQMRPATTPAEETTRNLLAAEMDAALARLREADRSVLTLRYLEDKSVAEVGLTLGISEDAAQKRINRAIERLRKKMGVSKEQVGAASLGTFLLAQRQIEVPAHLAAKVTQAMAAGEAAAASTTATAIAHEVLRSLFWSSLKVPLIAAVVVAAVATGAFVVERVLSAGGDGTVAPAALGAGDTALASPSQPASSNLTGADYPRVDGQRRATFRIYAPEAQRVAVQIGDTHDMTREADGHWSVTVSALTPGFNYYQFVIDGATVPDPGSRTFFGGSRIMSGLEVPEAGVDFYQVKDVPHGEIRARYYHSALTNSERQAFVYTPPGYDANPARRYPVLYLLHGMGEDQRGWAEQGRVDAILDNLIAEGKSREMIVVLEDAGTGAGYAPRTGRGAAARWGNLGRNFPQVLISETLPMIDAAYRTIPDREHRALAGLSLGGTQTFQITQENLDKFAYVGSFSAPFGYPPVPAGYGGLLGSPGEFTQEVRVLYVSIGGTENNLGARMFHQQLEGAGIPHVFFEAPGTANGWQTWRKSLHGFAQLLFQD